MPISSSFIRAKDAIGDSSWQAARFISTQKFRKNLLDLLSWIDWLKTRMAQQTQACDAEHGVEHIDHVAWSIRYSPITRVLVLLAKVSLYKFYTYLALENKLCLPLTIYPM